MYCIRERDDGRWCMHGRDGLLRVLRANTFKPCSSTGALDRDTRSMFRERWRWFRFRSFSWYVLMALVLVLVGSSLLATSCLASTDSDSHTHTAIATTVASSGSSSPMLGVEWAYLPAERMRAGYQWFSGYLKKRLHSWRLDLPVTINQKRFTAIVDTGAMTSVIGDEVVTRLGLQEKVSFGSVFQMFGVRLQGVGGYVAASGLLSLSFSVLGSDVTWNFIVMKGTPTNLSIVLGMDFLVEYECTVSALDSTVECAGLK